MKKNRRIGLDYLRSLCAFVVVLMHSASYIYNTHSIYEINWYISEFYIEIGLFAVPVFFMLSGCFLLNPSKQINFRRLFSKNIFKIVIAYIGWSIVYSMYTIKIWNTIELTIDYLLNFLKIILEGPPHFWYLVVLISIYLLIPILRQLVLNKMVMQYYIILFVIINFLLPYLEHVPFLNEIYIQISRLDYGRNFGFIVYFILGYYLNIYPIRWKKSIKIGIVIIAILFNPLVTAVLSYLYKEKNIYMENYQSIVVLCTAVLIFDLFAKLEVKNKFANNIISIIASNSFGVYLVHILVLNCLILLGIYTINLTPILLIPIVAVINFTISLLIIIGLKRIMFYINILRKKE